MIDLAGMLRRQNVAAWSCFSVSVFLFPFIHSKISRYQYSALQAFEKNLFQRPCIKVICLLRAFAVSEYQVNCIKRAMKSTCCREMSRMQKCMLTRYMNCMINITRRRLNLNLNKIENNGSQTLSHMKITKAFIFIVREINFESVYRF